MSNPVAEVAIRSDGLMLVSDLGSSQLPWSSLTEIWERESYWMVFLGSNQFFTLPLESFPHAARELVKAKVGGRGEMDPETSSG
jgi:hypothetical protein